MRHEAQLDAPVSDKDPTLGRVRTHLEALAARGNAAAIARLEGPEVPDELHYLLDYAGELAAGRRVGMNGPEALSWTDLDAWSRLTGRQLEPHEYQALMLIDCTRLHPGPPAGGDG